ncbi:MAG TPA: glycosyltransferase family 2 protein [Terriglobales bacterium]|nr:glycosyltransferase family 2 protein [Terriglobales bacterium]
MIHHDWDGLTDSSAPGSPRGAAEAPGPAPRPSMNGVFVVIAAFNEERTVGAAVRGVRERVANVVVVDDGSADRTACEAGAAGATVLRHLINRGQGAALKTGITYALGLGAEVIVTFDSDGQHQPEDLDTLVAPLRGGGVDVVLGSRFLDRGTRVPPVRWITLKLGIVFTRIVSRIRVTDVHNGLRAFTREAVQRMNLHEDRMAHASEILDEISRLGLRYREVPTRILYTDYSRQKGQQSTAAVRIALDFLLGKLGKGH